MQEREVDRIEQLLPSPEIVLFPASCTIVEIEILVPLEIHRALRQVILALCSSRSLADEMEMR
jgi:hypothetical protein